MRERFSIITVAIAGTALSVVISASITLAAAQAPVASASALENALG